MTSKTKEMPINVLAPRKEISKFMGEITFGGKAEDEDEYIDFMQQEYVMPKQAFEINMDFDNGPILRKR